MHYYFGDHDPSGVDIERSLQESLHRYAPAADITFDRVAVTAEDIEVMDLPGTTLNTSAFRMGTLVGAGDLDAAMAAQGLLCAAVEVGLPEAEARTTILSGLNAGAAYPRQGVGAEHRRGGVHRGPGRG